MVFRTPLGAAFASLAIIPAVSVLTLAHQQPAVFKSGVDLITVDVTVLDRGGSPIEGLTAPDFKVKVDGKERRVVWADFVAHRSTRAVEERAEIPSVESFSTNEHLQPGRLVMVAVDQLHIRRVEGLAALRAASAFVDSLSAGDRVAAAPLDYGGSVEFTSNHAAVKRYLQRLTGEASPIPAHFTVGLTEALAISDGSRSVLDIVVKRECGSSLAEFENLRRAAESEGVRDPCPVQVEQESRGFAQQARTEARLSLTALERMVARLGEIEGPKTLVLVSEGLVAEPQLLDLNALGAAAQAARVTIYVLQLDVPLFEASDSKVSPTMHGDRAVRADGLSRLAGAARGALFTLVGSDPHPFRRILRELSGHYLVAFEASDADRDGRQHRISVDTRASNAIVRGRTAFNIPRKLSPAQTGSNLETLLRSPRLSTELPLRVTAYSFQQPATDRLRVVVTAETDIQGSGRDVTIAYVLVNDAGVIVSSGAGSTNTGRFSIAASVPQGRYMLKAAAVEPGGRQGSVERRFNVRLGTAGSVSLSDLVVAEPAADAAAPLRPAVARATGEAVLMYFEAYGPADWTAGSAVEFELVGAGSEQPAVRAPGTLRNAGPGRWIVRAELSTRSVPPGPYTAAARLSVPGAAPHRLTRSILISK